MDSDDKAPDAALHVRFQMLTLYQPYDSTQPFLPIQEKGQELKPNPNYTGNPVYRDVPHIEITTPGGLNRIVEPVRAEHKARFKAQWNMFEMSQGSGDQIVGTKLAEWPQITRSRAEELRGMKYFVVEQIASASDQQIQGLGMDGTMLRMRAQQFLKVTKDTAHAERLAAESAAKDAQIQQQADALKVLQEQMAQLMKSQAAPVRRGRPPKNTQPQPAEA